MTRDKELLKQALTLLETPKKDYRHFYLCKKIRDRLAEPEEADHRHEYFRTGAMEPGESRCVTQEWVGGGE